MEWLLKTHGLLVSQAAPAQAAPAEAAEGVATLQVVSEQWVDTPISNDQSGRAQEYALRYAVVFSLHRADGSTAVPQQAVELARDYLAPAVDSIGTGAENSLWPPDAARASW